MINLQQKIVRAVATTALLASTFAPQAFADTIRISGNGRGSDTDVFLSKTSRNEISQNNNADFDTNVNVDQNTGGNRANDNTRGRVSIRSGNASSDVDVSNFANVNFARIGGSNSDWNHDHNNNDWNNRDNNYDRNNNDWSKNNDHGKNYDWNNNKYDWSKDNNHNNYDWAKYDNRDNHDRDSYNRDNHDGNYHDKNKDDHHDGYNHDNDHHDYNDNHDKNHYVSYGSNDGRSTFDVYMTGVNEVPGPGDQDGDGYAHVSINPRNDEVCVDMHVNKLSTPIGAHIHYGMPGVKGPIIVALPTPNADGDASGCVNANHDEVRNMLNNPSIYYVNVHSTEYPDGALRGQL